ncbi:MAG TPA: class I SAM-dependent methyltransferase [Thermoanaerobaculia bacterium]|nr:class I SAM-dependent methyltransferase [Thermoanaerobaculia bacterium]
MWRAALKGGALFLFGRAPGGAHFYRELTRSRMGTQATHVDKLKRVWPGYLDVWKLHAGLDLEGRDVWIHEGGWTPYPLLVNFLLTGKAGTVTNSEGRILSRYLARAVNGALTSAFPVDRVPEERRRRIEPLRWYDTAAEAIAEIGGAEVKCQRGKPIALPSASVDLCHSGGALEHYRPDELRIFLAECFRILRPGGIASHVFDHRDHLHHSDRRLPFLAHLGMPDGLYTLLCGHPLGYHNRLLPEEVAALFEAAGFERIALRRMILPDRRYVEGAEVLAGRPGLSRSLLRKRFQQASEEDLRTAAAHYLFRKPASGRP